MPAGITFHRLKASGKLSLFVAREKFNRYPLSQLTPCDYNPRLITDNHLRRLQASIREHTNTLAGWSAGDGFRLATTITVNQNGNRIVGGAQRVRALVSLGQDWIHADDITWVDVVPDSALEKTLNLSLNNREAQGAFDAPKRHLPSFKLAVRRFATAFHFRRQWAARP